MTGRSERAADGPLWMASAGRDGDVHIVLVHGTLDRSAGLLKLSRRLDDRALVTRYDRRGYGWSRPHDGPFTMAHQVADLVDVIDRTSPGDLPTRIVENPPPYEPVQQDNLLPATTSYEGFPMASMSRDAYGIEDDDLFDDDDDDDDDDKNPPKCGWWRFTPSCMRVRYTFIPLSYKEYL